MRHKLPRKDSRFSFAIIQTERGTLYRLCRRDFRNKLHFSMRTFPYGTDPKAIATWLIVARKELLERVDTVELAMMGYA
jgi:hypothetical protein